MSKSTLNLAFGIALGLLIGFAAAHLRQVHTFICHCPDASECL